MKDSLQEQINALIDKQKAIIETLEADINPNPSPEHLGDMFMGNFIKGKKSVLKELETLASNFPSPP